MAQTTQITIYRAKNQNASKSLSALRRGRLPPCLRDNWVPFVFVTAVRTCAPRSRFRRHRMRRGGRSPSSRGGKSFLTSLASLEARAFRRASAEAAALCAASRRAMRAEKQERHCSYLAARAAEAAAEKAAASYKQFECLRCGTACRGCTYRVQFCSTCARAVVASERAASERASLEARGIAADAAYQAKVDREVARADSVRAEIIRKREEIFLKTAAYMQRANAKRAGKMVRLVRAVMSYEGMSTTLGDVSVVLSGFTGRPLPADINNAYNGAIMSGLDVTYDRQRCVIDWDLSSEVYGVAEEFASSMGIHFAKWFADIKAARKRTKNFDRSTAMGKTDPGPDNMRATGPAHPWGLNRAVRPQQPVPSRPQSPSQPLYAKAEPMRAMGPGPGAAAITVLQHAPSISKDDLRELLTELLPVFAASISLPAPVINVEQPKVELNVGGMLDGLIAREVDYLVKRNEELISAAFDKHRQSIVAEVTAAVSKKVPASITIDDVQDWANSGAGGHGEGENGWQFWEAVRTQALEPGTRAQPSGISLGDVEDYLNKGAGGFGAGENSWEFGNSICKVVRRSIIDDPIVPAPEPSDEEEEEEEEVSDDEPAAPPMGGEQVFKTTTASASVGRPSSRNSDAQAPTPSIASSLSKRGRDVSTASNTSGASISYLSRSRNLPRGYKPVFVNNNDGLCTAYAINLCLPQEKQISIKDLPSPPVGGYAPIDFPIVKDGLKLAIWSEGAWKYGFKPEDASAHLLYTPLGTSGHYDALLPVFGGEPTIYPQGRSALEHGTFVRPDNVDGIVYFPPGGAPEHTSDPDKTRYSLLLSGVHIIGDSAANGRCIVPRTETILDTAVIDPTYVFSPDGTSRTNIFTPLSHRTQGAQRAETHYSDAHAISGTVDLTTAIQGSNGVLPLTARLSYYPNLYDARKVSYQTNVDPSNVAYSSDADARMLRSIMPTSSVNEWDKAAADRVASLWMRMYQPKIGASHRHIFFRLYLGLMNCLFGGRALESNHLLGNAGYYVGANGAHPNNVGRGNAGREYLMPCKHHSTKPFTPNVLRGVMNNVAGGEYDFRMDGAEMMATIHGGTCNPAPAPNANPARPGFASLFPWTSEQLYAIVEGTVQARAGEFPYTVFPWDKPETGEMDITTTGIVEPMCVLNNFHRINLGFRPSRSGVHNTFTHGMPACPKLLFIGHQDLPRFVELTNFHTNAMQNPASWLGAISFMVRNYNLHDDAAEGMRLAVEHAFNYPLAHATMMPLKASIRLCPETFQHANNLVGNLQLPLNLVDTFVRRIVRMGIAAAPVINANNWPAAGNVHGDRARQVLAIRPSDVNLRAVQGIARDHLLLMSGAGPGAVWANTAFTTYNAALFSTDEFIQDLDWYTATLSLRVAVIDGANTVIDQAAFDDFTASMSSQRLASLISWLVGGDIDAAGNSFSERWALQFPAPFNLSFAVADRSLGAPHQIIPVEGNIPVGVQATNHELAHAGRFRNVDLEVPTYNFYPDIDFIASTGLERIRQFAAGGEVHPVDAVSNVIAGLHTLAGGGVTRELNEDARAHLRTFFCRLGLTMRATADRAALVHGVNSLTIARHYGDVRSGNAQFDTQLDNLFLQRDVYDAPVNIQQYWVDIKEQQGHLGLMNEMDYYTRAKMLRFRQVSHVTLTPNKDAQGDTEVYEAQAINWVSLHPALIEAIAPSGKPVWGLLSRKQDFFAAYLPDSAIPMANWATEDSDMVREELLGHTRTLLNLQSKVLVTHAFLPVADYRGSAQVTRAHFNTCVLRRSSRQADALPYSLRYAIDPMLISYNPVRLSYDVGAAGPRDVQLKRALVTSGWNWDSVVQPRMSAHPGYSLDSSVFDSQLAGSNANQAAVNARAILNPFYSNADASAVPKGSHHWLMCNHVGPLDMIDGDGTVTRAWRDILPWLKTQDRSEDKLVYARSSKIPYRAGNMWYPTTRTTSWDQAPRLARSKPGDNITSVELPAGAGIIEATFNSLASWCGDRMATNFGQFDSGLAAGIGTYGTLGYTRTPSAFNTLMRGVAQACDKYHTKLMFSGPLFYIGSLKSVGDPTPFQNSMYTQSGAQTRRMAPSAETRADPSSNFNAGTGAKFAGTDQFSTDAAILTANGPLPAGHNIIEEDPAFKQKVRALEEAEQKVSELRAELEESRKQYDERSNEMEKKFEEGRSALQSQIDALTKGKAAPEQEPAGTSSGSATTQTKEPQRAAVEDKDVHLFNLFLQFMRSLPEPETRKSPPDGDTKKQQEQKN